LIIYLECAVCYAWVSILDLSCECFIDYLLCIIIDDIDYNAVDHIIVIYLIHLTILTIVICNSKFTTVSVLTRRMVYLYLYRKFQRQNSCCKIQQNNSWLTERRRGSLLSRISRSNCSIFLQNIISKLILYQNIKLN
jgi:hypothetical protein